MFDDRLATVLRMRAGSEAGLRTQFRQLLDLLGTRTSPLPGPTLARIARNARSLPAFEVQRMLTLPALTSGDSRLSTIAAFVRLDELQQALSQEVQSQILREPGIRLRDPEFVSFLAEGAPKPSAAAVATARLREDQWLDLIPRLPVTARGFLRHRRDLPPSVKELLARLGVGDLVLPAAWIARDEDLTTEAVTVTAPPPPPSDPRPEPRLAVAPPPPLPEESGIGALRRRIEAFRESRQTPVGSPRLPLEDAPVADGGSTTKPLDCRTDALGIVIEAEGPYAPVLVGLRLTSAQPGSLVTFGSDVAQAVRRRFPLRDAAIVIDAAPDVSGEWRMDASPLFETGTGAFEGYTVRLYRPNRAPAGDETDTPGEAMRQVLHELRTPVNAIQGFAEIIQQQIFGAVPHEYRAHAAAIAVDSAKLLAGFAEVERLVTLEAGTAETEAGECDFREAVLDTTERLATVLSGRNAGFALAVSGSDFMVAIDRSEAMALCWRLLATAAGALGPGEEARLDLVADRETLTLSLDVPETLRNAAPDTSRDGQRRRAISAGMFGPRFTFRLAEAEARAAGGSLTCEGDRVTLRLPVLTSGSATPSSEDGRAAVP
ncbi:sensor histidine kinase [Aurantiacibacter poecillastricola]|uniref:sensor histidine kinase n=1 Tax=Aurantiacibacter poecillastricola TaxID=3064385 RepID=UPI00273F2F93|nr:sensor histidine kinase [Aurantiacibacter sp. 219JJ12-13]MDP5262650.1 sensor histidine kinase [Aurantiacibacter sp. 219JJ12-13]